MLHTVLLKSSFAQERCSVRNEESVLQTWYEAWALPDPLSGDTACWRIGLTELCRVQGWLHSWQRSCRFLQDSFRRRLGNSREQLANVDVNTDESRAAINKRLSHLCLHCRSCIKQLYSRWNDARNQEFRRLCKSDDNRACQQTVKTLKARL